MRTREEGEKEEKRRIRRRGVGGRDKEE